MWFTSSYSRLKLHRWITSWKRLFSVYGEPQQTQTVDNGCVRWRPSPQAEHTPSVHRINPSSGEASGKMRPGDCLSLSMDRARRRWRWQGLWLCKFPAPLKTFTAEMHTHWVNVSHRDARSNWFNISICTIHAGITRTWITCLCTHWGNWRKEKDLHV